MNYNFLGESGIRVSDYCLGTMTFGHGTDGKEAERIVGEAFDRGVTFFDTANGYSAGEAEKMLGSSLSDKRDRVVLATKFSNPMGTGPNDSGWSRVHIMQALEASLRRLRTDYIDIYYIHHTENRASLETLLRTLDDLVRQGKVRHIACSNFESWRLIDGLWISELGGYEKFAAYQGAYSLLMRDMESEIMPCCAHRGLGVVAFWTLASGFLTGKYQPGQRSISGTRSHERWAFPSDHFAPNADEILEVVLSLSQELSTTPAAVSMAWVRQKPEITSVLFGARTAEQLRSNLDSQELLLPDSAVKRLDSVSRQPLRYPHWMESGRETARDKAIGSGQSEE